MHPSPVITDPLLQSAAPGASGAITLPRAQAALRTAAQLVKLHGEEFLPAFSHMRKLVQDLEAQNNIMDEIDRIAGDV